MNTIIATCSICGIASECEIETLVCDKCSNEQWQTKMMKDEMAHVATLAGLLDGWVKFQNPDPDFQAKAILYAAAAIIVQNDLDKIKATEFLNTCIHQFQIVNKLDTTDKH
jgi:hypothetical protein